MAAANPGGPAPKAWGAAARWHSPSHPGAPSGGGGAGGAQGRNLQPRDHSAAGAGAREHRRPGAATRKNAAQRAASGPGAGAARPRSPKGRAGGTRRGHALHPATAKRSKGDQRKPAAQRTRGRGQTGPARARGAAKAAHKRPSARAGGLASGPKAAGGPRRSGRARGQGPRGGRTRRAQKAPRKGRGTKAPGRRPAHTAYVWRHRRARQTMCRGVGGRRRKKRQLGEQRERTADGGPLPGPRHRPTHKREPEKKGGRPTEARTGTRATDLVCRRVRLLDIRTIFLHYAMGICP